MTVLPIVAAAIVATCLTAIIAMMLDAGDAP